MSKYDDEIEDARFEIVEAGAAATLRKYLVQGPADPAKPWIQSQATTSDYEVHLLILRVEKDGAPILPENHIKAMVVFDDKTNDNVGISINDQIILGSDVYDIVSNNPLQPDGVAIYHDLVLRK